MDSLQQQAEAMLQRDPQRMREQVGEQLVKKTEATATNLHEATQALQNRGESEESKRRLEESITNVRKAVQDLQRSGDTQVTSTKEVPERPQQ